MKNSIFTVLFLVFAFVGSAKSQATNSIESKQTDGDKIYKSSEVDKKVEITKRPNPKARGCKGSGIVGLRVVLRKTGKVTDVELFSPSPCQKFNEHAIEVITKFKFKPAIKDKQPVSTIVVIQFMYNTY
jgi:TonB family protein